MEFLRGIFHLYQDICLFNIGMLLNYLVIFTIAFGICVVLSNKLKIYRPKFDISLEETME